MNLIHKTSRTQFEYVDEFIPQFTNVLFVRLKNLKTGKVECFQKSTYLQFFEISA